jgi:phosphatidylserine decarboxylase
VNGAPEDGPSLATRLFVLLQQLLPHHLLSRLVGVLAQCRWPGVKGPFIHLFMRAFRVDLADAACRDPAAFEHFNAFFTRALRDGCRPLDPDPAALVCPADGTLSAWGSIDGERLLQAKGRRFRLGELLGGSDWAQPYLGGEFATVYLAPRDYHRVHMPDAGQLRRVRYVPGRLFSVNEGTAQALDRLFARNERLVCEFDSPRGPFVVVLVGAMIVAAIETVWAGRVVPPQRRIQVWQYDRAPEPVKLDRGAEMGRFLLGSTVILVYPPGRVRWNEDLASGTTVRMGQSLGALLQPSPP